MTEGMSVKNLPELLKEFREYGATVKTFVERAVNDSCLIVEREAKLSIVGPSTEVSEPGEPPKVKTGLLRGSITHRIGDENGKVVGEVGTNVEYALPLEFGTSKMQPRPFMAPAYDAHESEITEKIMEAEKVGEGVFK